MLNAEGNRLTGMIDKKVIIMIHRVIRILEQHAQDLDREIAKLIESDDDWRGKRDLLKSVPGVWYHRQRTHRRDARTGQTLTGTDRRACWGGADEPRLRHHAGNVPSRAEEPVFAQPSTWPRSMPFAITR